MKFTKIEYQEQKNVGPVAEYFWIRILQRTKKVSF